MDYSFEDLAKELHYSATHGYPKNAAACINNLMISLDTFLKKYDGVIDKDDLRGLVWDACMGFGRTRPRKSFIDFLNTHIAFYMDRTEKKYPNITPEDDLQADAYTGNSFKAFKRRNDTTAPEKIAVERAGRRKKVGRAGRADG